MLNGDRVRFSWFDGGKCEKQFSTGKFLYRVGKYCVIETDSKTSVKIFYEDVQRVN